MDTFITVEDARRRILSALDTLGTERVFLGDGDGRHIAESVVAPEDVPRFDNSSRDGYAVRWEDIDAGEATLEVVGESAAGHTTSREVGPGEAIRIATGAKVPAGADTVVMQENCERSDDTITVPEPPTPGRGAWIRHAGSYLTGGEPIADPGTRLGAAEIGLLASQRHARLDVYRRPRVAVVSTGDELVDIDTEPGDGQIVNSNAFLLETLLDGAGADPTVFPIAPDDAETIRAAFRDAIATHDVVVSSGGVSVGDYDEVGDIVDELTDGMAFWKIRMKPGKPLAFGTAGDAPATPVLGLPGNPNSCFVCFHQFVAPVLRVLQGADPETLVERPRTVARLADDIQSTPKRRHYLAGRLETDDGEMPTFLPAPNQASGNPALFVGQDTFGVVPEGTGTMEAGETIAIETISN